MTNCLKCLFDTYISVQLKGMQTLQTHVSLGVNDTFKFARIGDDCFTA